MIYCSISGYGQDGPYVNRPGHDLNYVAMSGILDLTGSQDGPPVILGALISDLSSALNADTRYALKV